MPARLAIQASRVHNAWLCLIWIVLFFRPQAKKAMRSGNATTMAASRHPDHRPEGTPVFRSSCGLRLAACPADCLRLSEHWKFPAVGFAVRSMKRGEAPRRRVQITNP